MTMPGFTAEESVYRSAEPFQLAGKAAASTSEVIASRPSVDVCTCPCCIGIGNGLRICCG
jgi:hypothetical protein